MAEAGYADGFDLELPTMAGQNHETLMPYITQQLAKINIGSSRCRCQERTRSANC